MNIAKIKPCDIANGPGVRVSVFVSGCRRHCPGCHNAEAWDFGYGEPYTEQTRDYILKLLEPDYIDGITILGGEPLEPENIVEIGNLLEEIFQTFGEYKTVWLYTGYEFEACMKASLNDPAVEKVVYNSDVIVDGEFIEAEKNISLRFRGSANQRIIDVGESAVKERTVLWEGEKK